MIHRFQVSNVLWDFSDMEDGEETPQLPRTFILEMEADHSRDISIDDISDEITDKYDFCHTGFSYYLILPMVNKAGE
jgi:hypothetical protein